MTGAKPDERIRTPMQWAGDATGGFTTGAPWEPLNADVKRVNVAAQQGDPTSLLSHYRRLIHLRDDYPALRQGDFLPVDSSCPSTFAFTRHLPASSIGEQDGQAVLVIANFASKGAQTGCTFSYQGGALPAGAYQAHDLLTDRDVAPLAVDTSGFQDYAPMTSLAPREALILLLGKPGS